MPDAVRARARIAHERMRIERHAPAVADAAEQAVERQPAGAHTRRGRAPSSDPSAASAKMYAKIDNGIPHHHSRLAPPTLHRVALEASTSIRGYDHTPVVSSPRPCKPRAAQHLNPLFRTESPKTEVQTAIAVLQAAEAEKERIREERRDARAAAKEAKRHAGDTRGAARRAAQSRAEILAHHRPARTDSLKDASDSDDSSDSNGETSSLSSLETNEKASGNKRKHQTHAHDHHTRSKVAKRRKKETKHHPERKHHHRHHLITPSTTPSTVTTPSVTPSIRAASATAISPTRTIPPPSPRACNSGRTSTTAPSSTHPTNAKDEWRRKPSECAGCGQKPGCRR